RAGVIGADELADRVGASGSAEGYVRRLTIDLVVRDRPRGGAVAGQIAELAAARGGARGLGSGGDAGPELERGCRWIRQSREGIDGAASQSDVGRVPQAVGGGATERRRGEVQLDREGLGLAGVAQLVG